MCAGEWRASIETCGGIVSIEGDGNATSIEGSGSAASIEGDGNTASIEGGGWAASIEGGGWAASIEESDSAASIEGADAPYGRKVRQPLKGCALTKIGSANTSIPSPFLTKKRTSYGRFVNTSGIRSENQRYPIWRNAFG